MASNTPASPAPSTVDPTKSALTTSKEAPSASGGKGPKSAVLSRQGPEDFRYRHEARFKACCMEYLNDTEWIKLEEDYESMSDRSQYLVTPNVQNVVISTDAITVRQHSEKYSAQLNKFKVKDVQFPLYGWEVIFTYQNISEVHVSQYSIPSWKASAPAGAMEAVSVVRFKCTGPPECKDVSELPELSDQEDKEGDEGREGEDNPAHDLPLCQLSHDPTALVGREIRLSYVGGAKNPNRPGAWVWPMIVNFLAGSKFHFKKEDNAKHMMPLDEWARQNKGRSAATLRETRGLLAGGSEWAVERERQVALSGQSLVSAQFTTVIRPKAHDPGSSSKRPSQGNSMVALDVQIDEAQMELLNAIKAARKAKEEADRAARVESDAKRKLAALEDERDKRARGGQ